MKYVLLLIGLFLFVPGAVGQDYAITVKNDTLRGEIRISGIGRDKVVNIRQGKDRTTYPFMQIKQYRQKNDNFQLVKGPDGYTFMKVLKEGFLSLYAYQLRDQVTYEGLYLVKFDGSRIEVPNLGFKRIMSDFLTECSTVKAALDSGLLARKNLLEVIDSYNTCLVEQQQAKRLKTENHTEIITKLERWNQLESALRPLNFDKQADALEVIGEIKIKIQSGQKVPNYMLEALKEFLGSRLETELQQAIASATNP